MDLGASTQDINDLLTKYGAIGVAAGPLAATLGARLVFGKSKIATNAVRLSVGWLAARTFLAPHVDQMHDTLATLNTFIHNNGF